MKLILNMEVENQDTFNKVYILGDNAKSGITSWIDKKLITVKPQIN